jgi:hypothetical protein
VRDYCRQLARGVRLRDLRRPAVVARAPPASASPTPPARRRIAVPPLRSLTPSPAAEPSAFDFDASATPAPPTPPPAAAAEAAAVPRPSSESDLPSQTDDVNMDLWGAPVPHTPVATYRHRRRGTFSAATPVSAAPVPPASSTMTDELPDEAALLGNILHFVQTDVDGSAYRRRRGLPSAESLGSATPPPTLSSIG